MDAKEILELQIATKLMAGLCANPNIITGKELEIDKWTSAKRLIAVAKMSRVAAKALMLENMTEDDI